MKRSELRCGDRVAIKAPYDDIREAIVLDPKQKWEKDWRAFAEHSMAQGVACAVKMIERNSNNSIKEFWIPDVFALKSIIGLYEDVIAQRERDQQVERKRRMAEAEESNEFYKRVDIVREKLRQFFPEATVKCEYADEKTKSVILKLSHLEDVLARIEKNQLRHPETNEKDIADIKALQAFADHMDEVQTKKDGRQ